MDDLKVVPDMMDTAPPQILHVKWSSGALAKLGNELTPTQVRLPPMELTWPHEHHTLYTLIMSDLDAPSRADPSQREGLHWLVVNIPGNKVEHGETYTEYIGSGPPEGTGLHRYVFVVFKQPGPLKSIDRPRASNRSIEGRFGFKTRDFVKQYKLVGPVAGNFFQSQFDNYVPILHAQLSTVNETASA